MGQTDPTSAATTDVLVIERETSIEDLLLPPHDGTNGVTTPAPDYPIGVEAQPEPVETALPAAGPFPFPFPSPFPLKRAVRGRYRSAAPGFVLELRVDIDGPRPTMKVSGDFYQVSGATTSYHSSFRVDGPTVATGGGQVVIEGRGSFTFSAGAPRVRVTIPRTTLFQPAAPATVQFLTLANQPGASYLCRFQSVYLRSVRYEQDCQVGVAPFVSYNTGSLPSGPPPRTLSVAGAYAEAGIELQTTGAANVIPAPPGATWSDAELHLAMQVQFSLWANSPQWSVWLLAAYEHDLGPGLYGIMFDQQGSQRQGCATFSKGIGGATADKQRLQLYTYVHELGHCFNLLHSWQKGLATPPAPNRPASLSWMNYPWNFPGGPGAFWSAFPFQFDDLELAHLRHAFRSHVIMGGSPFVTGSALQAPEAFEDPVEDNSGVALEIRARGSYALGEPVAVEIKLASLDVRGKPVHTLLHPDFGAVQFAVRKPSGNSVVFEPLIEHCAEPEMIVLKPSEPALYESAYLGFGRGGITFDEIGPYQIRALYAALDGSQVVSNVLTLWVRAPLTEADQAVAELLLGDEQGTLFYLLGSDSPYLEQGNESLRQVLDAHAGHPLAAYVRLVEGINAARDFKRLTPEKRLSVRAADPGRSEQLLRGVIDAASAVDNITLTQATSALVRSQRKVGNATGADSTVDRLMGALRRRKVGEPILAKVETGLRTPTDGPS